MQLPAAAYRHCEKDPCCSTCWLRSARAAANPATPPPMTATLPVESDAIVLTDGDRAKRAVVDTASANDTDRITWPLGSMAEDSLPLLRA